MGIKLKLTGLRRFVRTEAEIADYTAQVAAAQDTLVNGTGAGNDFLGWLNLPVDYDRDEFARIKQAAKKIQQTCDVLIVIGIGGSYLGARAAIEFVNGQFYNQVRPEGIPEVYFAGNNISSSYLNDIIKMIGDRDFCINIISKSGTTTEPAIAFRELKANTARRGRASASSPRRIRSAARSKSWRMTRATRPLLCRITSAAVSRCSRRSVCCRWLQPVWTLTR